MPQKSGKINSLGLSSADYARLVTFMAEIAAALLPGVRIRRYDDKGDTRFGNKGSLSIKDDGRWYSFEAAEGGFGPALLIQFLRPHDDPLDHHNFAVRWLHEHPGTGSCVGDFDDEQEAARVARHAAYAREVLAIMRPVADTPAATYLASRGLGPPWSPSLFGYLPDPERRGEGAVVGVATDSKSTPVCVQLGYIDAAGHKREVVGTDRRQFFIERGVPDTGFHILPDDPDPDAPLYVCEGLENARSLADAFPGAEVVGLPGIGWLRHMQQSLRGLKVVVVRDGDAPDAPASNQLANGIDHLILSGAKVWVTATPDSEDANSLLQSGGVEAIRALVAGAAPAEMSPRGLINLAVGLSAIEYPRQRAKLAKRAGMPVKDFGPLVTKEHERRKAAAAEAARRLAEEADRDSEPVTDIASVADTARAELGRYVVAEAKQLDMMVIWAVLTHFVHHRNIYLHVAPRLKISAPMPISGKTTALEAVSNLSHRPDLNVNLSPSAFFRTNDAERPSFFFDEMQGMLGPKHADGLMESILLSSHLHHGSIIKRTEKQGDNFVVVEFDTWCTFGFTISATKRLSLAFNSRCLHVTMKRALAGEVRKHLRYGRSDVLLDCGRKFARWVADQETLPEVQMPPHLLNRDGDNWLPLFSIAKLIGGPWPAKVAAAAAAAVQQDTGSHDVLLALLYDTMRVIGELEEIPTMDLLDKLRTIDDPSWDWTACNHGREINKYFLRDTLKEILEPAGSQRMKGKKNARGYTKAQFADACRRYLGWQDGKPPVDAVDIPAARAAQGNGEDPDAGATRTQTATAANQAPPAKRRKRTRPTSADPGPAPSDPAPPADDRKAVDETW